MHRKLLFLACFFICANCSAQQYPFVYYTPKDGLANSRVHSIMQDGKGRMYFSTYGGLSVYDGTRFTNYNQQNGLVNDLVNDVAEAAPDSFLIATNTQKLNTLVRGKIGVFKTSDNFCPVINHFFKSKDGCWYAGTDEGLFLFDHKKFIHLPLINQSGDSVGHYIEKIIEWKNYFLLMPWNADLKERLILYNKQKQLVTDISTDHKITNVVTDAKNRIWITTDKGISLLDTASLQRGKINFILTTFPSFARIPNSNVFFDRSENAWFYGGDKIQKISPTSENQIITLGQNIKSENVAQIYQDREGIIWMATDGNGIIKIRNTNVQVFDRFLPNEPLSVTALCQQGDTTWLFNNLNNKVYCLYNNNVHSFFIKKEKIIPSGMYSVGRKLYFITSHKIFSVDKYSKSSCHFARTILLDSSLTFGGGISDKNGAIILYIRKDSNFYLYIVLDNKLQMSLPIYYIADQFAIDNNEKLWVITRDNHLLVYSVHPEKPDNYLQLEKDYYQELPQMGPRALIIDMEHNAWIGTRYEGLYKLEFGGNKIRSVKQFTTKNGLTDNFIYNLACDNNNVIWIGTQTGLDKIFLKNNRYVIGNISKSNNFFQLIPKIVIAKNNTVFALTNQGTIMKILPSYSVTSCSPPELLLNLIQVNNVPADTIHNLSYNENTISFSAAAPSFTDEKSIRYSYSLKGSGNTEWSKPSENATFNFVNLSPGDYILSIRADFPEDMYPAQKISYAFSILPPWWQAWWFRAGVGAVIFAIATFLVRSYYSRKWETQKSFMERKHAIEKERTRIATDMHDDLGAGLTRIKFLSETIGIKKEKSQPIGEDIIKIRNYAHEMIDKMGEIVWALNEKNDSLSDLLSYTRAYAMEYMSQNEIACKVEMPPQPETVFVSGEFRRNIFLSIKESLHNIVKHAQAGTVVITFEIDTELRITIKDDGKGFNKAEVRPFSNGLYNIEKRMKEINGRSEIKNTAGTIISLIAPLS